jgi:Ca2+-binding RTX toxin-like protein
MAVNLTLTALTGNPHNSSVTNGGFQGNIDEELPLNTKLFELTGFDSTRLPPSGSYKIVAVRNYSIFDVVQENGKWYLVATGRLDFENENVGDFYQGIAFQFRDSNDTTNTGPVLQQVNVALQLQDVTEGPTNNPPPAPSGTFNVDERSAANTVVATLPVTDADGQTITYTFQGGGTTSADGRFKIVGNKVQVNTVTNVSSDSPVDYTIVANDNAGGTATGTVRITVKDVPPTNNPPPAPSGAASVDERSVDGTVVWTMALTDNEGQVISYTFENALDVDGKISLDGKFRIEGNKIVVRGTLSEVGGDTVLPAYTVIANDNSGASNGTVPGAVSITVKNVPVLSIEAPTAGSIIESDSGTVEYLFKVTRESIGSTSKVKWTVTTGAGIDANDFDLLEGTLDFDADDEFQFITLKVKGDRVAELHETFTVTLSDPEGAALNQNAKSAMGTITNDDHAPTLVIDPGEDYFHGPTGTPITGVLAGVNLEDLDGADEPLTLTVSYLNINGSFDAGMATGASNGVVVKDDDTDANGFRQFTLKGTAADIENFLAQRTFTPLVQKANTTFSFTLSDGANPQAYGDKITVLGEVPNNPAPDRPNATATVHESKGAGFVVVDTFDEFDGNVRIDYRFYAAQADSDDKISGDGRFKIVGNKIVVNDLSQAAGQATYVVFASDGTYSVPGNVTIIVKGNLGPTITSIAHSGSGQAGGGAEAGMILVQETAGAVEIGSVTASDQDATLDGRMLVYSLENTYNGLFSIDAAGKIRIADAGKLPVNGDTPYALKVRVSDGTAVTEQTVTVKVKETSTNQAPTGLSLSLNAPLLSEYAVPGKDVVGTLSASDANSDTLTYKLLDNAGGRFAIDGNKLVLAGPGVNFEDVPSHQIKVEVSDGKATAEQVFTIGVKDETTVTWRGTKKNDNKTGSPQDDFLRGGVGTGKDKLYGKNGDDKLYGESGNDSVWGGDGIDSLYGGNGNDTLKGETGKDLVKGDAGDDKAYGGSGNDRLYGGNGKDLLKGDADDDILYGEAGNDQLYGGAGKDVFVFSQKLSKTANLDKIMDFNVADDTIWLENKIFKTLGNAGSEAAPAALNSKFLVTGSKARDRDDYIIYDKKKGILYYDADGSGKAAAVEIATIKKNLKLTVDDFKII